MGMFKKLVVKPDPPRSSLTKKKGERSPSIRKELGFTPSLVRKTVEELYKERGILVVHFSMTNIKNFSLSEDGRFGIFLSRENKKWTLFYFKRSLRLEIRENPGTVSALADLLPLIISMDDYKWGVEGLKTADDALLELRNRIMYLMGDEIKTRLAKQMQKVDFIPPQTFLKKKEEENGNPTVPNNDAGGSSTSATGNDSEGGKEEETKDAEISGESQNEENKDESPQNRIEEVTTEETSTQEVVTTPQFSFKIKF